MKAKKMKNGVKCSTNEFLIFGGVKANYFPHYKSAAPDLITPIDQQFASGGRFILQVGREEHPNLLGSFKEDVRDSIKEDTF